MISWGRSFSFLSLATLELDVQVVEAFQQRHEARSHRGPRDLVEAGAEAVWARRAVSVHAADSGVGLRAGEGRKQGRRRDGVAVVVQRLHVEVPDGAPSRPRVFWK